MGLVVTAGTEPHVRWEGLPGKRALLIIPGMTRKNTGKSFRYPASTDPPLAWERFLAERDLWTITCNQSRKGAENETGAQQGEQDPFSLSLLLRDDFHPAGSHSVLHAKDSFPTSLTAACCHHSELSPQATGEGSVEISFTGIISSLTEMKPP